MGSPSWSIRYSPRATRDIDSLPQAVRVEIFAALERLLEEPPQGDLKKLKAQNGIWRLRVGKWRVLFTREKAERSILLLRVVRRSDTTYS